MSVWEISKDPKYSNTGRILEMFNVELEFTTKKIYKIKALDSTEAEDLAIEFWKVEYPKDNPATIEILGVEEIDVE
jgi:hypothetical protein